ncbi:MAG: helical backbone metal receptor, partial [Gemmatimonadota bacterium]
MATPASLSRLLSACLRCPWDRRFLFAIPCALLIACRSGAVAPHGPTLIDDAGDTVRLAAAATRIVSLSPATTELLFALGAGDLLVGRTRWCDYPAAALAVPSVGDGLPPNIEAVLAQHPDFVLLYKSPQNLEALSQLRSAGIAAAQLTMDHLGDVSRLARLLAPVLGRAAAADSLASAFDSAIASAARDTLAIAAGSRPTVLLLAWDQPPIAIGKGSFQSEILSLAGGRNLFEDLPSPSAPVSIEAIASRNPDLILLSDTGVPRFASRPEWQPIDAVRGRRFIHLASAAFGRPSPRAPEIIAELRAILAARPR